jgi:hypothetical protein
VIKISKWHGGKQTIDRPGREKNGWEEIKRH